MKRRLSQSHETLILVTSLVICIAFIWYLPLNVYAQSNQNVTISSGISSSPIQFDKKVFSWTDRVGITIYAPDFNSDPNLIDTIGDTEDDKINVCTTGHCIPYKLVETGTNTGVFSGYVDLTGDPSQKGASGIDGNGENPSGMTSTCNTICGPTDGMLPTTGNDGISVSFEYSRDQTVTGSALIRWHMGEVQWLQPNYPSNGQGTLQIVDPDMSIIPNAINKFDTNVWSDSDSGGIKLTMTETDKGTGVFQGTVDFTTQYPSSGNRLHVSDGDTVTGQYIDRTLPPPYSPSDQSKLTAVTTVGISLPPLESVPASNARIIDSTGKELDKVMTDQQVQIVSDVTNKLNKDQEFAYLVQIQDSNGITLSLSWITGSLLPNQSMSLSQSWIPKSSGTYTAQIFVWQGVTNPNALSPPLTLQIPAS
ncbi:MAG: hypothetical protein KGI08_02240 [Thaumarchaeota archaeon]|nr:hypothetical protein [Nitrososphaerota archaeon]